MGELFVLVMSSAGALYAESQGLAPHRVVIVWMILYSLGRYVL